MYLASGEKEHLCLIKYTSANQCIIEEHLTLPKHCDISHVWVFQAISLWAEASWPVKNLRGIIYSCCMVPRLPSPKRNTLYSQKHSVFPVCKKLQLRLVLVLVLARESSPGCVDHYFSLTNHSMIGSLRGSSQFYFTFRCVRRVPFEAHWLLTSRGGLSVGSEANQAV